MTYYIIYGFAEGPWHGQRLVHQLVQAGLRPAPQPEEADIIIAHSIGCYGVPEQCRAQNIFLVGIPYLEGNLVHRLSHKVAGDFIDYMQHKRIATWLQKSFWNCVYGFQRVSTWLKLYRKWRKKLTHLPNGKQVTVVRNQADSFSEADALTLLAHKQQWQYVDFPGHHDHLWVHPEAYVSLFSSS